MTILFPSKPIKFSVITTPLRRLDLASCVPLSQHPAPNSSLWTVRVIIIRKLNLYLSIALRDSPYRRVVIDNVEFFCRVVGITLTNPAHGDKDQVRTGFRKIEKQGILQANSLQTLTEKNQRYLGPVPGALGQAFSVWTTLSFLSYSSIMLPPTASSKISTSVVANFLALTPRSNKRSSSANVRP
jgi:hypothetical protein